jgi:two-component system CheB/CheR fusion protein
LFRSVPADPDLSFVVVTHLATGRISFLRDILRRYSALPVSEIAEGQVPQPNHIHVLNEGAALTLENGAFRLRKSAANHPEREPINLFLNSLAEEFGERSIAVVLSGGGSDGALGVKAIKEHGGVSLAQGFNSTGPRHSGMPKSAIATGLVDFVLPTEQMGPKLVDLAKRSRALRESNGLTGERLAIAKRDICIILRQQIGHDFQGYKDKTFMRRVHRRMQVRQKEKIGEYLALLRSDPDEVQALFHDLLIGVTSFFREKEAFEALERHVIASIVEGKGPGDTLRIWVPGCATGEEVYSIAILVLERLDRVKAKPKVQIFATDIDEASLSVARAGRYPIGLLKPVSAERMTRFFSGEEDGLSVRKEVRDLCIFSSHNLLGDPPYSRMDMISCRNLLIYLDAETQGHVISVLHYALKPGAFLFLGTSENVSKQGELFAPVDKKSRIFKRREGSHAVSLPTVFARASRLGGSTEPHRQGQAPLRQNVEMAVLERFAPAHVVVNREGDVLYYSARTGKYLEAAQGSPNRQLLAMARKGLRLELRGALREAIETRRRVQRDHVEVEVEDRLQLVTLIVEPFPDQSTESLYLVLFNDVGSAFRPGEPAFPGFSPRSGKEGSEQLESELRETKERLQSTVEEYETALEELKSANEELVSVNEELQSTNEELETSKEEIQSVNEELHTVNQELNVKVDELDRANTDLKNLFESTQIGSIFLDRRLIIRNFTPAVTSIFSLIPSDRGRPLTDIASHVRHSELSPDIPPVLAGQGSRERHVVASDGKTYLARLHPYVTAEGGIDGIVLTFMDVTGLVRAEEHQRALVAELNHRVKNMLTVVMSLAMQILARNEDPAAFANAFLDRLHALSSTYDLLSNENWSDVSLRTIVQHELSPFSEERTSIDGPQIMLQPKPALSFGMVLHELATNARQVRRSIR